MVGVGVGGMVTGSEGLGWGLVVSFLVVVAVCGGWG